MPLETFNLICIHCAQKPRRVDYIINTRAALGFQGYFVLTCDQPCARTRMIRDWPEGEPE